MSACCLPQNNIYPNLNDQVNRTQLDILERQMNDFFTATTRDFEEIREDVRQLQSSIPVIKIETPEEKKEKDIKRIQGTRFNHILILIASVVFPILTGLIIGPISAFFASLIGITSGAISSYFISDSNQKLNQLKT